MRLLLAAGANVNATDYSGDTALHCAASQTSESVVRLLLAAGAKVPTLHYAAITGRTKNIRILVCYNADPSVKDHMGETAFSYAVRFRNRALIDLSNTGVTEEIRAKERKKVEAARETIQTMNFAKQVESDHDKSHR